MQGRIDIIGDIGRFDDSEKHTTLVDVISQVKKQPEATGFDVYINSGGGYVDEGFDMYYYLKSLGVPINTIGQTLVASAATIPFMSGDTRNIEPDTRFMIHLPRGGFHGTADEIMDYSLGVKEVENRVLEFYTSQYGLPSEAVLPLLKNETFLTSENLKDLGITKSKHINIAARLGKDNEKPNKNTKMSKEKNTPEETSIMQKVLAIIKNGGDKVVAKTLFDENRKEVIFTEVEADGAITIGDFATFDGAPADGKITLADKRVLTFENGKLTNIEEAEVEAEAENEELVLLRKEVGELKTSIEGIVSRMEAEKVKAEKTERVINAIAKLEGEFVTEEKREKKDNAEETKTSRFQKAVAKK